MSRRPRSGRRFSALIDNDVIRQMGAANAARPGNENHSLLNHQPGILHQHLYGRVPHQQGLLEPTEKGGSHRFVELARRAMDALGLDYQIVFPTPMLSLGMHPQDELEAALGGAYNKWLVERILPEDDRLKGLLYLPFNTPEACVEQVERYAGNDRVIGFTVCSTRNKPVHHNSYMKLYALMEETGKPFAFHSGFNWNDPSFLQLNRFISMHALSFVHYNLIHMTNWIINGMPERFPKLKVMWVESGLAWIPYLMQRLDHEYQMRSCEAPLLKRLPSEYMRDMFYTSQPMEKTNLEAAAGDDGGVQRRDAAALCVGLAALGFRRAEHDHDAAVPERAGQAQHPRPQRRARLQSRGQAHAAEGVRRAGGAAGRVLMAVAAQTNARARRRFRRGGRACARRSGKLDGRSPMPSSNG